MNTNLIYDIGMNQGLDTLYYLRKGFKVIAVEANPSLSNENIHKFKKVINKRLLKILNLGIADDFRTMKFYINKKNDVWSSFSFELGVRGGSYETIDVQVVPFSDILEKYGLPFYLKIDIEGHDSYCLMPLKNNYKPKYISLEFSDIKDIKRLKELGYSEFKLVNQSQIFPRGSSGGFGEEAIDVVSGPKWKTYNQLLQSLDEFVLNNPSNSSWFDVHATYGEKVILKKQKVPLIIKELTLKLLVRYYVSSFFRLIDKKIGQIGIFLKKYFPKLYFLIKKVKK